MQVFFEIMVQIEQKRGIGVENPSPRSFSGGLGLDDSARVKRLRQIGAEMVQDSKATI